MRRADPRWCSSWTRQAMRATLGSKTLQNFAEIREIFAGKSCAFSARIAPHDHRKCQKPCMQSAYSFSRSCACLALVARAWRADLVPKSMQNRAVVAEINRRKSAHFDTERAHNVQNKHKNNVLMFSAPCRSTLVLFRGLDKPCGCVRASPGALFITVEGSARSILHKQWRAEPRAIPFCSELA